MGSWRTVCDGFVCGFSQPLWKPQIGSAGTLRSRSETAAVGGAGLGALKRTESSEGLSPPTKSLSARRGSNCGSEPSLRPG